MLCLPIYLIPMTWKSANTPIIVKLAAYGVAI